MPGENKLGVMPISKLIWNMSLPIIASMLVQALYNIVDSVFVSWVSEASLTAVSLAFPAQNLMISLGAGTAVGVNALMGRALGAGERDRANRVAVNGLFLALVAFVLCAVLGLTCAEAFLRSQTKVEEIVQMGAQYLNIVMGCSFGLFGQIAILCVMNLGGRTKKLRIVSPHGLQALYQPMLDMFCTDMRYEYEFIEVDDTVETIVYEDDFLTVTAFPLHHCVPCVGYLFKEKVGLPHINIDKINKDEIPRLYICRIKKGIDFDIKNGWHIHCADYLLPPSPIRSYAYCSDTSYFAELADYVRGCDFLYHEASFKEEDRAHAEKFGHSTAMDAARTAKNAEVKHLIIGHISERYGDKYEVLEEARSVFAHTILAQDLNIINIY